MTYQDLLQNVELVKASSQFNEFHLKVDHVKVDPKPHTAGTASRRCQVQHIRRVLDCLSDDSAQVAENHCVGRGFARVIRDGVSDPRVRQDVGYVWKTQDV